MKVLGIDIGGANLKAAFAQGYASEVSFALWRQPERLLSELEQLIDGAPGCDALAITMTGELADCYASKQQGVAAIVAAVEQAADGKPTAYYSFDGFVDSQTAVDAWQNVAAANWHALATAAFAQLDGDGVLIDVGSTTTDIVAVQQGRVVEGARTDIQRLSSGGLLYQGVRRTPICAVADRLPYRGRICPVAAEYFATSADVYLLLGKIPPNAHTETADGRPLNRDSAIIRLGRMLCTDKSEFNESDALALAQAVDQRMKERLAERLSDLTVSGYLLSGTGAWFAREVVESLGTGTRLSELSEFIGQPASGCGPAWAVATLSSDTLFNLK